MLLKLRNIGMIKEADVRLDGLTLIAGENDTGKSTVGKALFSLIKADMITLLKVKTGQAQDFTTNRVRNMNGQIGLVFKKMICRRDREKIEEARLQLIDDLEELYYDVIFKEDECLSFGGVNEDDQRYFKDALIIQTPFVWDLATTFLDIATLNQESDLLGLTTKVHYPYFLWDLFVKLRPREESFDIRYSDLLSYVTDEILKGEVVFKERKGFFFKRKDGFEFPVENLSSGGKSFLILQSLLANNLIEPSRFLIIDEPEVHLHPKWQLEYAKIIVQLVKQGVKVLVATHSPYMVEALEIQSKKLSIKRNFYFATKENQKEAWNSASMPEVTYKIFSIYENLAEPIDKLEDWEIEDISW